MFVVPVSSVQPVAINLIILEGGRGAVVPSNVLSFIFCFRKHVVDKMSCFILRHCDYVTGIPKK